MEDWKLADVNGIRKVLPNTVAAYWTASSGSIGVGDGDYYEGGQGRVSY